MYILVLVLATKYLYLYSYLYSKTFVDPYMLVLGSVTSFGGSAKLLGHTQPCHPSWASAISMPTGDGFGHRWGRNGE